MASDELARRLENLTPAQRKLLEARLAARRATGEPARAPLTHLDPSEGPFPLSFAQERFWLLEAIEPDNPAHRICGATRMRGPLDADALERALAAVVRRHGGLRTAFESGPDGPLQRVLDEVPVAIERVDLSALADEELAARREQLVQQTTTAPFDLSRPPLLRLLLLHYGPDSQDPEGAAQHELVTCVHHIATDGISTQLFVEDLRAAYTEERAGRRAELPRLPVETWDWAVWQRAHMQGERLERELVFWRERLADLPDLELPADRPRLAADAESRGLDDSPALALPLNGARIAYHPEPRVARELLATARSLGVTPYALCLTAFAVLLHQLTGQRDLAVGTPTAGRTREELRELIGLFLNSLVLRLDLAGDPTSAELAKRIARTTIEALAHQEAPFERVVDALEPERRPERSPLFQVLFNYFDVVDFGWQLPGLELESAPTQSGTLYDLTLWVWVGGLAEGSFWFEFEYDRRRFDRATMERWLARYAELVEQLPALLDRPLSALSTGDAAPAAERELRERWGQGQPAPPPTDFGRLVAAAAARTPGATAVSGVNEAGEPRELTFAALEARAATLAAALVRAGLSAGDVIGLALPRTPDLVAVLLAVRHVGAAWLPLDVAHPAPRLAAALHAGGASRVLTTRALAAALPDGVPRLFLEELDLARTRVGDERAFAPPLAIDPEALAYVITTSGSTGEPKAVEVPHRALAALLTAMVRRPGLAPGDTLLALTTLAFDIAALELLGPLVAGGSVHVAPDAGRDDGAELVRLFDAVRPSVAQATPSTWRLLRYAGWTPPADLRAWSGGEPLARDLAEELLADGAELWNLYGPTETTIWSTVARVASAPGEPVPIGAPIDGTRVLLLDEVGEPVPLGAVGELVILGAGLARGYRGRVEETVQRFPALAAAGGERGHRTGDLARWNARGELCCLGRRDGQVKLRGHRIEVGEIEAALRALDGVDDAAVDLCDGALAAWTTGSELAPETLRAALAERLPAVMVPARFAHLVELPRTPNGKLDRRALPEPGAARTRESEPPRAGLEARIAELWCQLLDLEPAGRIGREDDFFKLGGHSLTAALFRARLEAELGRTLALRAFFSAPTVAGAARLSRPSPELARSAGPAGSATSPPLSTIQERLWFLDRLQQGAPEHTIAGGLALDGPVDAARLEAAAREVVRRHAVLRTVYDEVEGEPVARVEPGAPLEFDHGALGEAEARVRARALVQRPFDLARGPLVRLGLYELGGERRWLVFAQHHIAGDGASMGIWQRELSRLLAEPDSAARLPERLPERDLDSTWAAFAAEERERAKSAATRAQLDEWTEELAGAPGAADLPLDRPRHLLGRRRGGLHALGLGPELTQRVDAFAADSGSTRFAVLLAAFQALLHGITGQSDLVIGTSTLGRDGARWLDVIGCFAGVVPLRSRAEPGDTFRSRVDRSTATLRRALVRADVPFDLIAQRFAGETERDLARTPLFQVFFETPPEPGAELDLPGVSATPLAPEVLGVAAPEFDLVLSVSPTGPGLTCRFEYDAALFDAPRIERLARSWVALLSGALAAPERSLVELAVPDDAERAELARLERGPAPASTTDISAQLGDAARAHPDSVAIVDGAQRVTYRELDAWSAALAEQLRAAGVSPATVVAVALERSAGAVASALAVWRAGACLVFLDPEAPPSRTAAIVAEARPRVAVVDRDAAPLEALEQVPSIEAHSPGSGLREPIPGSGLPEPAPAGGLSAIDVEGYDPQSDALLGFTSGSTGRPKGVRVPRAALANHAAWVKSTFALATGDRVALRTPLVFDAALWELLPPLTAGAALVVADARTARDPARLLELARTAGVTVLQLVPSLLAAVLDELETGPATLPEALRHVIAGGEALPAALAHRYLRVARSRGVQLWNLYGPTEACIDSTAYRVEAERADGWQLASLPLGRPIAGVEVLLLEPRGETRRDEPARRVPLGAPGELCVAGRGLALGYLDRREEEQRAFVPHPDRPGERLYRTGDRARWRSDGALEYLGRLDDQVQIRGVRVEPGEVEAVLATHPALAEVAVVARSVNGEVGLEAHAVAHPVTLAGAHAGATPSVADLAAFAATHLPAALRPRAFALTTSLPRTASEKVDRRALPPLDAGWNERGGAEFTAPRSPHELEVAAAFSGLLDVERVGVHDDFFRLGGHSLLAVRLVARLAARTGRALELEQVFADATPAGLARAIENAEWAGPGLELADGPGPHPLTFEQERLWFLHHFDPESTEYDVVGGLRLRGALEPDQLESALQALSDRHPALRTRFRAVDGAPVQVEVGGPHLGWRMLERPGLVGEEREQAVSELLTREAGRRFDLELGPLWFATLLRFDARDHALVLGLHHLVCDARSLDLLSEELSILLAGERLPPAPDRRSADLACTQRAPAASRRMDRDLAAWRAELAGAPPELTLPTDRPRPAVARHRGAQVRFALGADVRDAAEALARELGTTRFSVLLAAWQLVLARAAGADDVVIGTSVDGRDDPELARAVGFFANSLPLRLARDGAATFRAAVEAATVVVRRALTHRGVPLARLVQELAPERDRARPPLFQVTFDDLGAAASVPQVPGLVIESTLAGSGSAKFDLALVLESAREGGGLSATLEYDTDLFEPSTAQRFAARFEALLRTALGSPEAPLAELLLEPAAERVQLEALGQGPPALPPSDFGRAFAVALARTPRAVAVRGVDERGAPAELTYARLDRRARALAAALRRAGVSSGDIVALALPRTPDLVAALLAVRHAGAAWLPLDTTHPSRRIRAALRAGGARLVLTTKRLAETLPEGLPRVFLSDLDDGRAPGADAEPAPLSVDPERLAYVITTSGSTGEPKAVEVSHRALDALLAAVRRRPGLGPGDMLLALTTPAFDIAALELLGPITAGGTVHVAPDEGRADGARLARLFTSVRPDVAQATPSTWRLLRYAGWTPPAGLRVWCGGEPLARDLAEELLADGAELWNLYGPTETTIWSTAARVVSALGEPVPIGTPLDGTRAHVLDDELRPVPLGSVGELVLSGRGVARGYRGRPEETEARFPTLADGTRAHRTGDLARYTARGDLVCLGRRDGQVKLRGHRIELGEIEAALRAIDGVEDAAVDLRDAALAAWTTGVELGDEVLRAALAEQLPAIMVPTCFGHLEALPRTANGKLDRRALPISLGPRGSSDSAQRASTPPRAGLESQLADLWCELLDLERAEHSGRSGQIGREDDFFRLGGHSLLAARLVAAVAREFGVELGLQELFADPRLAAFAERIQAALDSANAAHTTARAVDRSAPLPASPLQERLWFLDRLDPGSSLAVLPGAVRLRGALDVSALERALAGLLARHEVLRSRFREVDGRCRVTFAATEPVALPIVELGECEPGELEARELEVRELGLQAWLREHAAEPFDLERGPLLRAALARLAPDEHVLFVGLHHAVADGLSLAVLRRDLAELYAAAEAGRAPELPHLPLAFADRAAAARDPEHERKADVAWWRTNLEGAPLFLALPTDRPRPRTAAELARAPGAFALALDPERTAVWRRFAAECGSTLFELLATAFAAYLGRLTGQAEVVVGTAVANRGAASLDDEVGPYANVLPLRLDATPERSIRELLARGSTQVRAALAHQAAPFEAIVAAVAPPRDLARPPLMQASFDLEPARGEVARAGSLEAVELELPSPAAKLELAFSVRELAAGLELRVEYAAALFDAATVERWAEGWAVLLDAATRDPAADVLTATAADDRARATLLAWGNGRVTTAHAPRVDELLGERARTTPEATALIEGERRWTWAELAAWADAVAADLVRAGAGPERTVGVLLPRSARAVVAAWAVWRAGAAYLPLEVDAPAARLAALCSSSATELVLTDDEHAQRLPDRTCWRAVLDLAPGDPLVASAGPAPGAGAARDAQLAYVFHTSGSTGAPKGVEVEHRALARHLLWLREALELGPSDRFLMRIPTHFDASLLELLGPALGGGALVVAPPGAERDPAELVALAARERVTCLLSVPSQLAALVEERGFADCRDLRLLLAGGEGLTARTAARATESAAAAGLALRLHDLYGPTECNVQATWLADVGGWLATHRQEVAAGANVPIGRPVDDTTLVIVDPAGRLLPPGAIGELCLGGPRLARGYRGRPDLTSAVFVPDPLRPGARVYRTGDLARWNGEGLLEFQGRVDDQVKVGGRRVEPGEVEAVLAALPGVRECAVAAPRFGEGPEAGEARLVAWVAGSASLADGDPLRRRLAERLPPHLLPTRIVSVEALPRLSSGKLDRSALTRGFGLDEDAARAEPDPPRSATPLEARVLRVFAATLERETLGLDDDFFEAGGTSLTALRLRAALQAELGREVAVRTLFELRTPSAVTRHMASECGASFDFGRLARDAELSTDVVPDLSGARAPALALDSKLQRVLLTGATGFLGAALLRELLDRTGAEVVCLVRADDVRAGRERLAAALRAQGLGTDGLDERVLPLPGRLDAPRFGLAPQAFDDLANELDAIFHCGAAVDFLAPYERLFDANVGGTREVLRLAARGRPTPVHHVSTVGVLAAPVWRGVERVAETDEVPGGRGLETGYDRTKWVAERLVREAGARGLAVTIFRPGRVAGSTRTGAWNSADLSSRIFRACLELRRTPETDAPVDLVPVDWVAAALVHLARRADSVGRTFHLVHPAAPRIDRVFAGLRAAGAELEPVAPEAWRAALEARGRDEDLAVLELLGRPERGEPLLGDGALPQLGRENVEHGLAGSALACPPIDAALLATWLTWFRRATPVVSAPDPRP